MNMTKQYNLETNMTIQRQVMKIIAEKNSIRIEDISSEKSFSELGSDSLTSMEMIMAMENEFNIEIPEEDAVKLTTVQAAIDFMIESGRISSKTR